MAVHAATRRIVPWRIRRRLLWRPGRIHEFAIAVPDLLTRALGAPFSETHSLVKAHVNIRKACSLQVYGASLRVTFYKDHYCAWREEFEQLPDQGRMRVRGHESWFGKHIDRIEPLPIAPKALNSR